MTNLIGQQLGNYRLISQVGQGGFAVVYLGEHVHLKTQAAIKVLQQVQLSSDEEEKFRKEAFTIAMLRHQNIIRVLDYGIQESTSIPFLVMDYAKETLRQRYPKGTILSPLHILPYVKQVASALEYAHEHKVIHRDVKPENMLLDENNNIRLSDFGIAVVYETSHALNTLDKFGTPSYMAPEQFQGKPLPASDQYSLGIVVYEWLCGTRPFNGPLGDLIRQHESAIPPSMRQKNPSLSSAIEKVILKALAKKPEERYASVWDFFLALQDACQVEQAGSSSQLTEVMSSLTSQSHSPTSVLAKRARPIVATPPEDSSVIWNVPYRRNTFFTGRTQVLALLHDTFYSEKAVTKTPAVSGLGGIGKTQIAVEYVYRYHSEYKVILWVRGDIREKMLSDIATLATILNLKEQHEQAQRRVIEAVRTWLRKNTQWLLIIDNIEDLRLVQTLLPSSARGHILLTTRTQTTGNIAQCIDLGKMTLEEGALFLLRRTKILPHDATFQDASTADCQRAKEICEVLDRLPLALDQAGAYIEESGCNLANYLDRYKAGRMKLLSMRSGFDFDHPLSVTDTFSYCFDKIEKISPAAVELLRYCAFLHSDTIPEELITKGAAELGPTLQPVAADPFLLDAAIVTLRKFSLVHRNSDTNMLSLHRLVQAVLQDSMSEQERRIWVERTVRAINLALPDISEFSMWQCCQQYMPHVQNCVALIEQWKIVSPEAARLLEQTGMYLQVQAQFTQAQILFEQAADMRTLLGAVEPAATAASLSHLFWHYYYQGQYAAAEQPIWKALRLLQQTPGTDQLLLALYLEAIAYLFYQQGKYSRAEEYFLQALAIYEERVGLQHPLAVCAFSGLGNVNLALANYDLAERFFWDALNIWQQMPGPQHPFMGASLNGLAQISIAHGKYTQAELYLQQERIHLEQTLPPLHLALANNLNDWALLYIAQGKYNQVEPHLRQSLTILEQTVGLQHPIAGHRFDLLGRLSYLQGSYKTAEQLFQKAQSILEQALGVEHPDVLSTINNLADVYAKQCKRSMAEELYKDVLAMRTRILGTKHPAVAQTLHGLAQLSYFYGRYAEAEDMYKQVLSIRENALGKEHPDVAQSLHGLALIYFWKQKKFELAESHIQRALAIYEKAQLLEHLDLARILKTYASFLLVLDRKHEAAEATARAKTILAKHALMIDMLDE
jgi:serine/threonine protein kinase/tetratricopeptide (TPR) repeat protein